MTDIAHAPHSTDGPPRGMVVAPFDARLITGLTGIMVAAMMAGLNSRVGALTLVDVQGALGMSADRAQFLHTVYASFEMAAMPIAAWFGITLSLRRTHVGIVTGFMIVGLLIPLAPNYGWMVALNAVQGFLGGALIPLLMSSALRFLPPTIKLHGLGLYSLTATFAPNLAVWFAGLWIDQAHDWQLVFWQVVPIGLFCIWAVAWGIPQDEMKLERFRHINLFGLISAPVSLVILGISLLEGERLDWFSSPLITGGLIAGTSLLVAYLVSEYYHHEPFMKLQLLVRRNFYVGFPLFIGILMVLLVSAALPADYLASVQGFRPIQIAPIGLVISLPQLILAPVCSALLYKKWLDARVFMAAGLVLIALGCWLGSQITTDWMAGEFYAAQICQMLGQPMVIIALLFLLTGVAAPMEGPYLSGGVNMLRSLAMILGGIAVQQLLINVGAAHLRGMADRAGLMGDSVGALLPRFHAQATTLAIIDGYRIVTVVALLLIIPVFMLERVPAPDLPAKSKDDPK